MEQLCEPLEVNRKFIKLIETVIEPHYNKQLNDIFSLLKKDIDDKYKPANYKQTKLVTKNHLK